MMRSATRARTSSSWKIARNPAPRARRSAISSTTAVAIGGVERGGRLVEDQQLVLAGEAARDVDALLLAARKGRGRQRPQPFGQIEPREQRRRALRAPRPASSPASRAAAATMSSARDARDDAQELADIAHQPPPRVDDLARARAGDVEPGARRRASLMLPAIGEIIAEHDLQDRRFADAGGAAEHDAFAARDARSSTFATTGSRAPPCRCSVKALATPSTISSSRGAHAASTEETRSCV